MIHLTIAEQISVITFGAIPAENECELIYRIFKEAAQKHILIDMISRVPATADKTSVGFTFRDEDTPEILKIARSLPYDGTPIINSGNVKLVVQSEEMIDGTGFAERVFEALCAVSAAPILITTALDEISVVVRESDSAELERKLNELFR
ncbi:MAG: hypothetical protein NC084_00515 [Bacteroides sp.]|nr:hypothetical protein [Eubacterium sp.]MCM1417208.1 hypothetical protein [Roseburia sp.]MCM1461171.1 hypothetical protein [Bacteroides sp.]